MVKRAESTRQRLKSFPKHEILVNQASAKTLSKQVSHRSSLSICSRQVGAEFGDLELKRITLKV